MSLSKKRCGDWLSLQKTPGTPLATARFPNKDDISKSFQIVEEQCENKSYQADNMHSAEETGLSF
jgi:hypothetical protein